MSSLEKIVASINTRFGKTSKDNQPLAYIASERPDLLETQFLRCNVPQLNKALGGGFAKKSIHLISGDPGSGKTTLCLSLCLASQKEGKIAVYVNAEPPFPVKYAEQLGLDLSKLLILDPKDFGEQIVDAIYELLYDPDGRLAREDVGVIVIDSINGLVPKSSIERSEDKGSEAPGMAERARLITQFLERIQGRGMLRGGATLLLVAQERTDIGSYGAPTIISGGKAAKYMPKTITRLGRKAIRQSDVVVGHTVKFNISKNGISGIPNQGEYNILYGTGVDDSADLWERGVANGFIIKEGRSTYVFNLPSGQVRVDKIAEAQQALLQSEAMKQELREVLDPEVHEKRIEENKLGEVSLELEEPLDNTINQIN
jgi:recombination protein RecA